MRIWEEKEPERGGFFRKPHKSGFGPLPESKSQQSSAIYCNLVPQGLEGQKWPFTETERIVPNFQYGPKSVSGGDRPVKAKFERFLKIGKMEAKMSAQCYLKKDTPELSIIGGIGEFAVHLPALPVPESIANQYDTPEMQAQGWIVSRIPDDHGPKEETAPVADSFRLIEAASQIEN